MERFARFRSSGHGQGHAFALTDRETGMARLSEIPGLLTADCPLEWAWENMKLLGRGEHACIFEHPSDNSRVVRISDYPDGWFEYVTVAGEGLHVPRVFDFATAGGCFLAIAERLEPVPDDAYGEEMIDCAVAVIWGEGARRVPDGALDRFRQCQPGFEAFVGRLPFRPTDLRNENFMMKGGTLVLNDPLGSMSFEMERDLKTSSGTPSLCDGPNMP